MKYHAMIRENGTFLVLVYFLVAVALCHRPAANKCKVYTVKQMRPARVYLQHFLTADCVHSYHGDSTFGSDRRGGISHVRARHLSGLQMKTSSINPLDEG